MADVERTCDRIIVLQGGNVVQAGEVTHFTKETETVFIEVDTNREGFMASLDRRGVAVAVDGSGFTIEPGQYFKDFGVRTEINMVWAGNGPEVTGPRQKAILSLL